MSESAITAPIDGLVIVRMLEAPREKVFEAFTNPEMLRVWWGPEGANSPDAQVDARVGGDYRLDIHGSDGSVHQLGGRYKEVSPPEKLVFTWQWLGGEAPSPETQVTIELADLGARTRLTLTHEGFANDEAREAHNRGWISSMVCLQQITEEG
ncbi:MAG: SRPBCC domain-containing protein [Alphaproteobacteria bacterium]|jgi:uncharacterized protein YndB with AHSA1/START domain|nr:SRPBCC domain-containing protein [Alphaproteobacteria bacterium]MDP6565627.1 SRPBCC domain-containing protein [Alphaproteobacteria bacterium]MDP6813242.1 SRPBCC domain-containing protein [Alphaproteobacteria bacterium]